MERIKERNRRKAALSDRKSAAAQARMKNIASLAADERVGKKRRKGGGGACFMVALWSLKRSYFYDVRIEDMFGADDGDWAIYRKIVRITHFAVICVTR
jgi:actin-related protein 5